MPKLPLVKTINKPFGNAAQLERMLIVALDVVVCPCRASNALISDVPPCLLCRLYGRYQ
jgi:hypothetical protein